MNKQTILKKAVEKAVNRGYEPNYKKVLAHQEIIFSHDFAKAFWNKETKEAEAFQKETGGTYLHTDWRHYLQRMVLEKEPLLYLEKFLNFKD